MLLRTHKILLGLAIALAVGAVATPAQAARTTVKKGIWGPVSVRGESMFPFYRELGVGVYSSRIAWNDVAPTRPVHPRNPNDPAYRWSAELDRALEMASRYRMRVAVDIRGAPAWANGNRPANWVPTYIGDWRNFVAAAARRYPGIDYWIIWAEPSRQPNFMPLVPEEAPTVQLDARRARAPQKYARLLDAAYGELKRERRRFKVVGGNTFVGGDVSPFNWIRNLRLPNGRRPRMDLYGHHPFTARRPDLSKPLIRPGLADFSDLDTLAHWVDRYLGRGRNGRRIKLYLGEWSLATDHQSRTFNIWVSRRTQANWLRAALRIVRRWDRIETLVWLGMYDEAPNATKDETRWGLITFGGKRKPSYYAFKRG